MGGSWDRTEGIGCHQMLTEINRCLYKSVIKCPYKSASVSNLKSNFFLPDKLSSKDVYRINNNSMLVKTTIKENSVSLGWAQRGQKPYEMSQLKLHIVIPRDFNEGELSKFFRAETHLHFNSLQIHIDGAICKKKMK